MKNWEFLWPLQLLIPQHCLFLGDHSCPNLHSTPPPIPNHYLQQQTLLRSRPIYPNFPKLISSLKPQRSFEFNISKTKLMISSQNLIFFLCLLSLCQWEHPPSTRTSWKHERQSQCLLSLLRHLLLQPSTASCQSSLQYCTDLSISVLLHNHHSLGSYHLLLKPQQHPLLIPFPSILKLQP